MTYTPSDPNASDPNAGGYQAPQATPGYGAADPKAGAAPQYSTYGNPAGSYGAYAAPKPKSDKKTFGLWALILGISSIVIPLGLNGVAGIVLGIVGLIKENSKGMSITGIITGAIGVIWAPFAWSIVGVLIAWATLGTISTYDY